EDILGFARLKDHALSVPIQNPEEMRREQRAMAARFVRERRESGAVRDDAIDVLLHATVGGRALTEDEVVANIALIMGAGLDTTKSAICNVLWRITQDPALEARLRGRSWAVTDLDEFLRIDAPVTGMSRTARRDTVLGGCPIAAGEKIHVMFAAAN